MSKSERTRTRTEKAAAIRAAQANKERTRRVALVVGILVVLGAIVAAAAWSGGRSSSTADYSSVEVAVGDGSVLVGDADAPVTVVIYEDFLCPFCRQLEESTRDFLRENAAEGTVQVEYRPINLLTSYPYSAKALNAWAAVLKNASPQAALKFHDLLFEKQPYEQSSDDVTDADLAELVKEAGADNAAVAAALTTPDTAFFEAASEVMQREGITGTPTVVIDGKQLTGLSVGDLREQIEEAVSAAP